MHDDVYFRNRILDIENRIGNRENPSEGAAVQLVQTVTVKTYPTVAASFYAVQVLGIDGTALEGQTASFTPDPARIFYAANLGTAIPPVGTKLLVTSCGGRKVFRYDG